MEVPRIQSFIFYPLILVSVAGKLEQEPVVIRQVGTLWTVIPTVGCIKMRFSGTLTDCDINIQTGKEKQQCYVFTPTSFFSSEIFFSSSQTTKNKSSVQLFFKFHLAHLYSSQ